MSVLDTIQSYVPPHVSNPRLSTPGPIDVPRWNEGDADKDIALNSIGQMLQQQQQNVARLTLPELNLANTREVIQQRRDSYVPGTAGPGLNSGVNHSGTAVNVKSGGVTAYGYKGVTGVAGTKGSSPYGFQPEMWTALMKANAAMKAAGLGEFKITDGWRSYESQVSLKKKKPSLAATPGKSIHGLGLAADLQLSKAQQQWLYANGAKFGLYAGAGFNREPWHWQLLPSLYTRGW